VAAVAHVAGPVSPVTVVVEPVTLPVNVRTRRKRTSNKFKLHIIIIPIQFTLFLLYRKKKL